MTIIEFLFTMLQIIAGADIRVYEDLTAIYTGTSTLVAFLVAVLNSIPDAIRMAS
jgi:hypothetical protein